MISHRVVGSRIWVVFAALAVACGGDDDGGSENNGGGSAVKSGVPEDKMVNTLTAAEAEQVSAAFGKAVQDSGLVDSLCTFNGIFGEQVAAAFGQPDQTCEKISAECKSAPEQATESSLAVNDDPAQLTNCTVTVGELETCLTAMLDGYKQSLGGITCDSDLAMLSQSFAAGMEVSQCEKVQMACPEAVSSGTMQ